MVLLALSSPEQSIHAHHSLKFSEKSNQSPSCVPGSCQISAFIRSVSKLSACQVAQYSCVFLGMWLDFKTPNFWDPGAKDLCLSSGVESQWAEASIDLSQKSSPMTTMQFRFYVKAQPQACTKACCCQLVSLFLW